MVISDKLKFILKQYEKNRLSHAFLIETNNINRCELEIREILKIINCPNKYHEQCDKCNICKLIDINNLPNLLIVRPDKMSIKKGQLEEIESKFSTKPVFSKYNSYIIVDADKMNDSASNSILKFLEEPEDNIIGFFIVRNKENVLSTIKSRCEIIHVKYEDDVKIDDNIVLVAQRYIDEIKNGDDYLINKRIILSNFNERKDIESIFIQILKNYCLELESNINNSQFNKIYNIISLIQKMLNFIEYNVNLELILDCFVIEMRKLTC